MEKIDSKLLQLMRDGGINLCNEAIKKWQSDEYGYEDQEKINEWKKKQQKIEELYSFLISVDRI